VAQDRTTSEETDHLFGSGIYADAGVGVGYHTGLWSGFPYSAFTAKAGNRWNLSHSRYRTYNIGIQFTWADVSIGNGSSFPYRVGFGGFGISNMFRIKSNIGFEVNINLIPNVLKGGSGSRYYGPTANLELRIRYKRFYLGIDSGILINIGAGSMVYGGYTGLKLGFNLFVRE
jgi:hypothetical protein